MQKNWFSILILMLSIMTIGLVGITMMRQNELQTSIGDINASVQQLQTAILSNEADDTHAEASGVDPVIETHEYEYDFGEIPQSGGVVEKRFEIENHGKGILEIGEITTSCACATATVEQSTLAFDEHTDLVVKFDPDFHEEPPDRFKRQIWVASNDPETPELTFTIWVDILEGE